MKKKIIILTTMFLTILQISAQPTYQLNLNFEYSYDTDVFSDPLPTYDKYFGFLLYKQDHPFKKIHNIGFNSAINIYFKEDSRVGLSSALSVKIPLQGTSIRPVAEDDYYHFEKIWEYHYADISNSLKTAVFGSIGPIFRYTNNYIDIGAAIRLSIGSYEYVNNEVITGIQIEPFVNYKFSNNLYINLKLTYDAHLMKFRDDEKTLYEEYYRMLSLAPSIGIGFQF